MFRFRFDLGRVDNQTMQPAGPVAAFEFVMQPHLVVSVPIDEENNRQVLITRDKKGRTVVAAYGLEEGELAFNLNYFRDERRLLGHLAALDLSVEQLQEVHRLKLLPVPCIVPTAAIAASEARPHKPTMN